MTLADRAADLIAEFGGSWKFIGVSIAMIVFWIIFNSIILVRGFDPAPYQMLNLVLAVIAGMQAPIIMMSQNRQGEKDRLRADLDYQVNLKNELSLAEVLRRLDVLESERLPKLIDDLRSTNQMIKAIFFDFNGVIIDDETIQMKAYQEVLRGTRSISPRSGT